jgi:hypothetical protein
MNRSGTTTRPAGGKTMTRGLRYLVFRPRTMGTARSHPFGCPSRQSGSPARHEQDRAKYPERLEQLHSISWAAQQGLAWEVTYTPGGEQWGCRLEIYHDEPGQDMSEWETELAFKLAG